MSAPYQTSSTQSTSSHAHGGMYHGRIENIEDPQRRNRIQVRIFGYQDDKGLMPSDKLEWIHVAQHNSQLPNATATQPYYVGGQLLIGDTGNERYVIGAIPGFDGVDREQQASQQQADTSSNKKPDTTTIQAENDQKKNTSIRIAKEGIQKTAKDLANKIGNWQAYVKDLLSYGPYTLGQGAPKAPFGEGTTALLNTYKSIGNLKLQPASDVLDVIKQLDGNISGSILKSLDIIKNLRMNGFGTGMQTIGSGNVSAADAQFNGNFGTTPSGGIAGGNGINLLSLLRDLLEAIQLVNSLTASNLLDKIAAVQSALTTLMNTTFNVDPQTIQLIENEIAKVKTNGPAQQRVSNHQFFVDETSQIKSLFAPAFLQALTSIMSLINDQASIGQSDSDIVISLGGSDVFVQMAKMLLQIASLLSIPQSVIMALANGLIGKAINGTLSVSVTTNTQNNNNNNTNNNGMGTATSSSMAMNPFIGNAIAIAEIKGGQIINELLNKKPRRYNPKKSNEPKVKHADREVPAPAPTPPPPPDPDLANYENPSGPTADASLPFEPTNAQSQIIHSGITY